MRRSFLLAVGVALAVLLFAPIATAQTDDNGMDDNGMHARSADDRGFDDRGMDDQGMDDRGFDDDVVASPTASATAMSSASASSSPTSSASATSSAAPSASSSAEMLPDTGGTPLIPALSAAVAVLLVGSGVATSVLVRRVS